MRDGVTLARDRVDVLARQQLARREADRVDQVVEAAQFVAHLLERPVESGVVADVGLEQQRALQVGRELLERGPQALRLVGERQAGPGLRQRLRYGPTQRTLVGHAHDQTLLPAQIDLEHVRLLS